MPSPRRHGHLDVDYKDDEASSEGRHPGRRSSRPRGYGSPRRHLERNDSLMSLRDEDKTKGEESDWDTDYDPRDKYYLSEEDDPLDLYSPSRKASVREASSRDRHRSSTHRSTERGHSSRRRHSHSHSHSHSHAHSHSRSHRHSHARDDDDDDYTDENGDDVSTSRHKGSSHSKSGTHAGTSNGSSSRPRPKPSRAGSSYLNSGVHRPRAVRATSSYTGSRSARPHMSRNASLGLRTKPKSVKAHPKVWEDINWQEAAKVAMQAGTVAAIKVGTDSIPWPVKGTKIASAALGAAVVDHVLKPKKKGGIKYAAMRHLAEVAVGNLVVGPAMKGAGGHSRGGGSRRSK